MEGNNSKEINLLDLIRLFLNGLKKSAWNLFILLGDVLRLLYRNKIVICVFLVFALALGWYMGLPSRREYEAETMAIVNGSLSQAVKEVSRQLESSSHLSDFTTLSSKLSLHDSITRNITGIESFYVIDFLKDSTADMVDFKGKHPLEDTLNVRMPNRLYFRIRTKNISQIPVFEDAFLNYFNTNKHLRREFEVKKNNLSEELRLVTAEINRLDSMATISYLHEPQQQVQIKYNTLLVGEQEKRLVYKDFLLLQKLKGRREAELASCTDPIVLPTGFVIIPQPVHGRIFYLFICGLVGVILAMLFSLFIENRKCIFHYLSKK